MAGPTAEATFAAGCFWGVEARFRCLPGVTDVEVGYAGGSTAEPTYHEVCTGRTGHAESVHVVFDPQRISYEQLLEAFWGMHDPTTPNRQGPDVGSQYRSVVFYHSEQQREAGERLTSRARAERGVQREAHRDRDRAGRPVLARRGVPPALLREAGARGLRHVRRLEAGGRDSWRAGRQAAAPPADLQPCREARPRAPAARVPALTGASPNGVEWARLTGPAACLARTAREGGQGE